MIPPESTSQWEENCSTQFQLSAFLNYYVKVWQALQAKPLPLPEMFNEAQEHVYQLMERTVLEGFLQHQDGRHYLEALVSRDNHRREKQR